MDLPPGYRARPDPPAVRDLARLHHRSIRAVPFFREGPGLAGRFRRRFEATLRDATIDRARVLRRRGDAVAYLLLTRHAVGFHGGPIQELDLAADRRSPVARRWLAAELAALAPAIRPELVLHLLGPDRDLLPALRDAGLGIEAVNLTGSVRTARSYFRARTRPVVDPGTLGLRVEPLGTAAQVDAALHLKRAWFREHPEHGWFCADEAFLAREREELLGGLGEDPTRFVFLRDRRVVGLFGFGVEDHPMWGRQAHPTFDVAGDLHGKGLLTFAYRFLLDEMAARGVRLYAGGTSQPGVLALSGKMGRRLFAWVLRPGPAPFPPGHFAPYV